MKDAKEIISLAHGGGGKSYHCLVREIFVPAFDNPYLRELNDSAVMEVAGGPIAMTTDSYVVKPRFFPGGDIGRLAVCGTVNDLAMSGAEPKYITCGMIIEAGFPREELERICASMAAAAAEAGVLIVSGDTKVVEKGSCDGIYINTAGVGVFPAGRPPLPQRVLPGDAILVSGTIGDHGMAVLAAREQLDFSPPLISDVAPLHGLARALMAAVPELHALRDATRGGVAGVAHEWAEASGRDIVLDEVALPVNPAVRAACELLGLDPLYVANEGKLLAAVPAASAEKALRTLQEQPAGRDAAIIGTVEVNTNGILCIITKFSSRRFLLVPDGEQIPRIC